MKLINEGSSFIDYIETFLFFTPSIDSDNEDIWELDLSFKSEDDNSTKKSTIKSEIIKKEKITKNIQKIKSCLLVIYDLYFIIFKNESNKNSFNKSNILRFPLFCLLAHSTFLGDSGCESSCKSLFMMSLFSIVDYISS